jgi:integrase
MGHIQDRWFKKVVDPETEKVTRVKTPLYGKGLRYKVRYLDPDGTEKSESFPDRCRGQAEDFLLKVENELRQGSYIDPDAGRILLKDYAERWVQAQTFDETTRETTESRLRSKVLPFFKGKDLSAIKPTDVRGWLRSMQQDGMASSYQAVCFAHLSAIFTAAVDDKLIASNPCHVRSVTRPKPGERKVKPWSRSTVKKVHMALPERFKIMVPIGAGCGLRQGEIFGLGVDAIDREGLVLHVVRQLREVRGQFVFAPPKRGKSRDVPLSRGLLARLDDHMKQFPPVSVTLPWREPSGEKVTVDLLITNANGYPLARRRFNPKVWHVARSAAGIANPGRDDGMHALRHHYASVLLDAGESIKALSEYLGHTDPGFTLRTYTHLMPSSAERTRRAVDDEWGKGDDEPSDGLATA